MHDSTKISCTVTLSDFTWFTKPNGIFRSYQWDQSISFLRVVGWCYTFIQIFIGHFVSKWWRY